MRLVDGQIILEKLSVISYLWNNSKVGKEEQGRMNFGIQKHVAAASIVLSGRALDVLHLNELRLWKFERNEDRCIDWFNF